MREKNGEKETKQKETITPPPNKNITKIIRPEYFYVILGGDYGKIT